MKGFGIILITTFHLLLMSLMYDYFFDTVFRFYIITRNKVVAFVLIAIGVFFTYNLCFNYWMAIL